LPSLPFEIAKWYYDRKIHLDCHVVFEKKHYSCPYKYVGKSVDIKASDNIIEIYYNHERISTHERFPNYIENKWSTHEEDMPDQFQKPEWDDQRIRRWAYSIGPNTGEVIDRIFKSVRIKEQGYNSSLSVLKLGKAYSEDRLEVACEIALKNIRLPRYHHLKTILSNNQDVIYLSSKESVQSVNKSSGYVRGASYYGGNE